MEQQEMINDENGTENVILALQKVITLLDRIKSSIEESSSKIPKAAVQLTTVTQATEMATVEILDVLDRMGTKIHIIENGMKDIEDANLSERQMLLLTGIKQTLSEIQNDTNNITVVLQIQDITAQKIGAANHLIESVRRELLNELNYFETAKMKTEGAKRQVGNEKDTPKHFDVNASYMKSTEHQSKIDKVVSDWHEKNRKSKTHI